MKQLLNPQVIAMEACHLLSNWLSPDARVGVRHLWTRPDSVCSAELCFRTEDLLLTLDRFSDRFLWAKVRDLADEIRAIGTVSLELETPMGVDWAYRARDSKVSLRLLRFFVIETNRFESRIDVMVRGDAHE